MEWKDIETAPKDESVQILITDGSIITIASWDEDWGNYYSNELQSEAVGDYWYPLPKLPEPPK